MKTIVLRAIENEDKAGTLLAAIRASKSAPSRQCFEIDPVSLSSIPGSPLAYWVSGRIRSLFLRLSAFETDGRTALGGLKTLTDERFLRTAWEIPSNVSEQWPLMVKGGAYSPFYGDVHLRVNWKTKGEEISWYGYQRRPREGFGAASRGIEFYFRPGLTWPRRTNGLSIRVLPSGCIFADKGPAAFADGNSADELFALSAIGNSRPFGLLVSLQLSRTELAQSFEVGIIQRTPIPDLIGDERTELALLARRAWSLKRALDTRTENSHAFSLPGLLQVDGMSLAERAAAWGERVRATDGELAAIQAEIDDRCFDLYGIGEEDRRAITEGFGAPAAGVGDGTEAASDADDSDTDESDAAEAAADAATLTAELVSWSVGAAFGRFDVRLATGARAIPGEPEPFDALPVCSPGMLTGADGLPLAAAPDGYPLSLPDDGILVDDLGHPRDLTEAARLAFDEAIFSPPPAMYGLARYDLSRFDSTYSAWDEAAEILDPKGRDLRSWLAKTFFEQHVRRYSKSRRKAPIYWQLATPSASYSVWLYIHRATADTLYTVLNEYAAPKLQHEERRLSGLIQEAGPTPSAGQRRDIAEQETFVGELQAFRLEVARVAPLWAPDLNDGVIINFAPLWRLIPQHRGWQKEVKACWDSLCAGKYDWSHLAMRLWPERVVPKCADDRSLAIAHDLEAVFWVEGADGKWIKREISAGTVERLVADRTSPAVKAALADLPAAPVAAAGRAGGRRARAAR